MAQKKAGANIGKAVAIGAGAVALSAAAYLLFGPEGKKHRKDLKSWMVKMRAEVMEKMEKAKEVTAPVYHKIVDEVEAKYSALKHVDAAMLKKEAASLKKHWKEITDGKKKPAKKAASRKQRA